MGACFRARAAPTRYTGPTMAATSTRPNRGWRGSMTLPRELALARDGTDLVLIQRPPAELARLRGTGRSWANETISGASTLLADVRGTTMEISATFRVDASTTATRF